MADDQYRQYKEDAAVNLPERTVRDDRVAWYRARRALAGGRVQRPTDYTDFKANIASAVEELRLEIRDQHEQTRVEVVKAKQDVLTAVKASPAANMKLLCEFGFLFFAFSLAIRYTLRIELVNTAFALFMLFALGVYWAMARMKQESEKRSNDGQNG
jgi:hypothetical protein